METYSLLRQFADSWALLALTLIFLGVIVWAFRPGSRPIHDDAADVPFRNNDERPAPRREARAPHNVKGNGDV
ncbi:CcoQ/FixQ family Cbb3-type cytochrome c oxidase assembly chaperone [Roseovarius nanhaiticus]|uniref:Cytochrome c oxidase cbb3-type subunit 4 n=1 Tax=Roseovarius nanhaiticus TaxID=573024 RepID=A0A1N7HBV8_9RHOB|nr:CcoQ/FixQ family Cbb3-type cytochrome c oxidase assembly chaperone [Roseovarius nanhaiticus]SEL03579.1 cytochrome c oxidase cbb3-type subunit 4 [Roseovarius nanhaiticus]SIS22364.1 cytochrome c oxidase cbb3-type subunit 4 [Roseovarius nanhaiticus]